MAKKTQNKANRLAIGHRDCKHMKCSTPLYYLYQQQLSQRLVWDLLKLITPIKKVWYHVFRFSSEVITSMLEEEKKYKATKTILMTVI